MFRSSGNRRYGQLGPYIGPSCCEVPDQSDAQFRGAFDGQCGDMPEVRDQRGSELWRRVVVVGGNWVLPTTNLEVCSAWASQRRALPAVIGGSISLPAIVRSFTMVAIFYEDIRVGREGPRFNFIYLSKSGSIISICILSKGNKPL